MNAAVFAPKDDLQEYSIWGAAVRTAAVLTAAAGITLALFFLMRALIWTDTPPPTDVVEVPAFVIAEIPPDRPPVTDRFPDAPEAIDPPPPIEPLRLDPSEGPGVSPTATQLAVIRTEPDLGSMRAAVLPPPPLQIRVPPAYPQRELSRGVEGSCVIQYDILASGRTVNARALACDSSGFARTSLDAVAQWRHAPVSGPAPDAIVQRNVQTRLDFTLEG
jgi:protein TonB